MIEKLYSNNREMIGKGQKKRQRMYSEKIRKRGRKDE